MEEICQDNIINKSNMKLDLHFDETIYRKQMKLLYDSAYARKLKYYKNSHYFGFTLLIIGILIIMEKRDLGYLFAILGVSILIPYFILHFKLVRISKKFAIEENLTISIYKEFPITTWEFLEESFKFSDYKSKKNIEWTSFLTYKVIDDNLFLFTKNFEPYILDKHEVGDKKFNKILEIVKCKITK